MKRILFLLVSVVIGLSASAQSVGYVPGKVAFSPVYDTAFSGWPQEITDLMQNKLTQIVMQNGVGSLSDQYVLTANIALEDKQVTATAPAQYVVKLAVQLLAIDVNAQILIRELTLNVTGVDRSENRAYLAAVRQINPRNPLVKSFIQEASDVALAAYNQNVAAYINNARALEQAGNYDEALYTLAQIPKDVDRYDEVWALSSEIVDLQTKAEKAEKSRVAAQAAQKAEEDAEALQRQRDMEVQQQMIAAMEKKQKEQEKGVLVDKVKKWFLGSMA